MTASLRIASLTHQRLLNDLSRSHTFALERVAFAFGRVATTSCGEVVIVSSFEPVADDDYEEDKRVAARIGRHAIHKALQRAAELKAATFHVHVHQHEGRPRFSTIDMRELPPVMQPFMHVVPEQPHGLLVFSDDDAFGLFWKRGQDHPTTITSVSLVGLRTRVLRGERQ